MRTVSLQQICDIQIGKTPSRSVPEYWGGELPWVTISDFAGGRIVTTTKERITRIGAVKSGSKRIPRGTLLLSFKLSLGKRAISGCDLFTNEAIAALHVLDHDVVDRDYLYWALGSINFDRLVDRAAKGKTLNKAKLRLLRIPLPPLWEQKRIVGTLDAADALRAKRREALGQLDSLLRSTFLDMFGDPDTNPMEWEDAQFGDIVTDTRLGLVRSSKEFGWDFGTPYVRMNAVSSNGYFLPEEVQSTHANDQEVAVFSLRPGDFLFNTRNSKELVGKVCVFPGPNGWLFNNNLMRVRFRADVEPWVIAMQFGFRRVQRELEKRKSGTTSVFAIYWKSLRTLPVLVPPSDLQQRFSAIVQSVEHQKLSQRAHLAELDTLFASLQSRAFRGDL